MTHASEPPGSKHLIGGLPEHESVPKAFDDPEYTHPVNGPTLKEGRFGG